MALNDLTPAAVESAIREYDQLGRDAFLGRYGFGPAQTYFVQVDGALYDSKAIAGVAHQYSIRDRPSVAINRFVAEHTRHFRPFVWTADPDKIIAALRREHQALDSFH